jgi:hypothetical protein
MRTCIIDKATGKVEAITEMGLPQNVPIEEVVEFDEEGIPSVVKVPRFVEHTKAPEGKLFVPHETANLGDTYKKGKWKLIPLPKVEPVE